MSTVNLSLLPEHVQLIDTLVKQYGFESRSEFMRSLIRLVHHKPELIDQAATFPFIGPSDRSKKKILADFKKTNKYSPTFLKDLAEGLENSDYFTK